MSMYSPGASSYVSTSDEEFDQTMVNEPMLEGNRGDDFMISSPDNDDLNSFDNFFDKSEKDVGLFEGPVPTENEPENKFKDKPLTLEQAFNILFDASQGKLDPDIPVRAHASPINPKQNCFYVSSELARKKRRRNEVSDEPEIRVKFQSFHNTDIWWSPKKNYCMGVIARAMSRKSRSQKNNASKVNESFHGYIGCLYSLIQRSPDSRDKPLPTSRSFSTRSYVVDKVPSLVNFVSQNTECETSSLPTENVEKDVRYQDVPQLAPSDQIKLEVEAKRDDWQMNDMIQPIANWEDQVESVAKSHSVLKQLSEPLVIHRDVVITGELSVKNLHVKGDLHVEGNISGQLVTPPGAADYAEWFAYKKQDENIEEGMVVQLQSPDQQISLNCDGDGPHLIVSTKPSVAAGVDSKQKGALCAFIGQVPLKVRGPVKCGAMLFPSGKNDGYAVQGNTLLHGKYHDPIGTAMESCGEGDHVILSFIRWQHNLKWQALKRKELNLKQAILNMSNYIIPSYALLAWWFADLARGERSKSYRNAFLGFSLVPLWVTFHLPGYHQYMNRDIYFILPILAGGAIFNLKLLVSTALNGTRNERSSGFMYLLSFMNLTSIIFSSIRLKLAAMKYSASFDEEPTWWEKKLSGLMSFRGVLNWNDLTQEIVDKNRKEKDIISKILFKNLNKA